MLLGIAWPSCISSGNVGRASAAVQAVSVYPEPLRDWSFDGVWDVQQMQPH